MSVRAPVGPTNVADQKCCIGRGLAGIHPTNGITTKFVLYFFRCIEPALSKQGTGSTFTAINKQYLESLEVAIPSLKEQTRIVEKIEELFSELDKGVESLKTAQLQLKVYRQALLKQAFEGKLTEQWRKDNPEKVESAEQLLVRIKAEREARYQQQLDEWKQTIKDWEATGKEGKKPAKPKQAKELPKLTEKQLEQLPKVPSSFVYIYLADAGQLARGKSKHRPRNDPKLFGGKYPFIQTGEVKAAMKEVTEFSNTYSDMGLAQSKLWPKETLCITIAANIAETAFLGMDACFPDSVVGFTAYGSVVNKHFVELFIRLTRDKIEAYAPATAQKNINLTTLENLVIPFCTIDEQCKIVEEIDRHFSVIDQLDSEIEINFKKSEALRQSILKKAFSGQLVAQDPDDEPASELLKRIRTEREAAELAEKEAKAKAKKAAPKRKPKATKPTAA